MGQRYDLSDQSFKHFSCLSVFLKICCCRITVKSGYSDRRYVREFYHSISANIFRENHFYIFTCHIFCNFTHLFRLFFRFSRTEDNTENFSMSQDHTRLQNIGRYVDTSIRHCQFRKFFLKFSSCPINIEDWKDYCIFSCKFPDHRNCFRHRITFYTDQDHIRCITVFFHCACFYRNHFSFMIPQAFHAQTIFSDRLKVFSSGDEGYIFSCLRQKKAKTSAGSASSDNCIFHITEFSFS